MCGNYATTPVAGCAAHYAPQAAKDISAAGVSHHPRESEPTAGQARPFECSGELAEAPPAGPAELDGPRLAVRRAGPPRGAVACPAGAVGQATQTLQNLVGYLLK